MKKAVDTVKKIFKEHYGMNLNFQWAGNLSRDKFLLWNQCKTSFRYSSGLGSVYFPVFSLKKDLKALFTVKPVFKEDPACFREMADFLKLTVSELLRLDEIYHEQNQKEDVLKRLASDPQKVIPFKIKRKCPVNQEKNAIRELEFSGKINLDPIWIAGDNTDLNTRIAFSIHELSSNWAFINVGKTPDLIWEDIDIWRQIPQVTILVSNIELLSNSKVTYLNESLKFIRKLKNKPLLVVTSSCPVPDTLKKLKFLFRNYYSTENIPVSRQAQIFLNL